MTEPIQPVLAIEFLDAADDVAICDPCRDGTCDDCAGWAWCDLIDFPAGCDCKDSGHQLQRDIAEDEAADRALSAHYEETA